MWIDKHPMMFGGVVSVMFHLVVVALVMWQPETMFSIGKSLGGLACIVWAVLMNIEDAKMHNSMSKMPHMTGPAPVVLGLIGFGLLMTAW
ncbi:MAG: hypothetical protein KDA93_27430 [Planctomycetaceae bacterium]|nr:hypothetical protein [Planctomycetaceae bacterium]